MLDGVFSGEYAASRKHMLASSLPWLDTARHEAQLAQLHAKANYFDGVAPIISEGRYSEFAQPAALVSMHV